MNVFTRMMVVNSASSPQGKLEDGGTPHWWSAVDWRKVFVIHVHRVHTSCRRILDGEYVIF